MRRPATRGRGRGRTLAPVVTRRLAGSAHADGSAAGPAHAAGDSKRGWKAWLRSAPAGFARFLVVGGVLGFAGFWFAPVIVDTFSGYDQAVFGATLFLFIGWTFINVHHKSCDPAPRQPRIAPVSVHRIRPPHFHRKAGRPNYADGCNRRLTS